MLTYVWATCGKIQKKFKGGELENWGTRITKLPLCTLWNLFRFVPGTCIIYFRKKSPSMRNTCVSQCWHSFLPARPLLWGPLISWVLTSVLPPDSQNLPPASLVLTVRFIRLSGSWAWYGEYLLAPWSSVCWGLLTPGQGRQLTRWLAPTDFRHCPCSRGKWSTWLSIVQTYLWGSLCQPFAFDWLRRSWFF